MARNVTLLRMAAASLNDLHIEHDALEVIAESTHIVISDRSSVVVKVPRPNSPVAEGVRTEAKALKALKLYNPRVGQLKDGRFMLVTDYLGVTPPLAEFDTKLTIEYVRAISRVHDSPPPDGLPAPQLTLERFAEEQAKKYPSASKTLTALARPRSIALMEGLTRTPPGRSVFLHGDPNERNIVRSKKVSLIDWERFCTGPREADIAVVALNVLIKDRQDVWQTARAEFAKSGPINEAALDWSFRSLLAGSLSHAAWREGLAAVRARMRIADDYLEQGPALLLEDTPQVEISRTHHFLEDLPPTPLPEIG